MYGSMVIFDGLRTPILSPISKDSSASLAVKIESPSIRWEYELLITPVQENVAWFDELGFEPSRILATIA